MEEYLGSLDDIYVTQENGKRAMAVTGGGQALDVLPQDQTTPAVIAKFNQIQAASTLAVATAIDDRTIEVVDATGFQVGHYIVMYDTTIDRYFLAYILSIAVNVITVDTPLDAAFPIGAIVGSSITNMNVNGSVTPQVFGLRGSPVENPLNITFDITRIIFHCQTASAVDLSKFGDIVDGLTNGLILRRRNQEYNNIFNVKTNGDIAGIMYDFTATQSANPQQGQDGFYARLTFASQGKLGVAIRLEEGTDLEFIVQDDLTGITLLEVVAEGHVVN